MITFERSQIDSNKIKFVAVENECTIGSCTLLISSYYADVSDISYSDNGAYIVEGLIKSALYYAGQRGCYIGRCNCSNIEAQLKRINFVKSENGYENDIPTILAGSCSGCKNNI